MLMSHLKAQAAPQLLYMSEGIKYGKLKTAGLPSYSIPLLEMGMENSFYHLSACSNLENMQHMSVTPSLF